MTTMRAAIVGAGLTGLATAAAFSRNGHQVRVFEQAPGLRASGLAINLWSNATSLLPGFGIPAHRVPGEPFSRMLLRASGREVAAMELPAEGLPHVNVERAELLTALAAVLPPDAVTYGARCADPPALAALAGEHDLVVVADGANSALRTAVARPPRKRWTWTVWQACVTAEVPEVPPGTGASVFRPGLFCGIWRLPEGRVTWFAEQPGRSPADGARLLRPEERRGSRAADAGARDRGRGLDGVARAGHVAAPGAAPRQRRAGRRRRPRHAADAGAGRVPVPGGRRRAGRGGRGDPRPRRRAPAL
jgi:2-polyprenyl-6-methoxyphenol hydroxylase-like FAD-dependent oxidoreductase